MSTSDTTPTVADSEATDAPLPFDAIHQGDCVELLGKVAAESVDLAFADPPFNIGFKYDEYHDSHEDEHYIEWCEEWIRQLYRVLKPSGAFWLAIGDEYAAELKVAAKAIGFTARNWIVWYYTFGQNCTRKFNRSHAHLFHFVKDEELHTFNAEDPAVRVPSARALVYGDRRANPTGRLPDDTWILRPQDLRDDDTAFQPMDDTWYFSRVAGTFKERQGFHGCQMPEQLLGRIVRISSNPGELVLDPFSGSGTTLAVAKKLGRHALGFELSSDYAKYGNKRLESCAEGDDLNGPADPVGSAPTTAAGRRLKGHPMAEQLAEEPSALELPVPEPCMASEPEPDKDHKSSVSSAGSLRELTQQTLIDAFLKTHDEHSIDWLLCDPKLQDAFHAACQEAGLIGGPVEWNRELLKLRKSGKMPKGKRKQVALSADELENISYAAEIAWRQSERKFPGSSLDDLFSSPGKSFFFDRAAAKQLDPSLTATSEVAPKVRWAALRLRKARKSLAAEAKDFDYVLKKRDFARFQPWARMRFDRLNGQAGVYLLRSADRASLYLGESANLGRRLAAHAASRGVGLRVTQVGLILSSELPSDEYRLPLWVNLVRRYKPTMNVTPANAPE